MNYFIYKFLYSNKFIHTHTYTYIYIYIYIPIKSATVLALVNLPVTPSSKSTPYGRKLALAKVGKRLLLPLSSKESPNTYSAGASGLLLVPLLNFPEKK